MAPTNKNKRLRDNDQDSDTDSDTECSYNSCNNWPKFLVMESSSDDLPLSKLSPFAVQKGFQAVAGTLKSIKWLRDGSCLVECARKLQAMGLLKTTRFVDRPVCVSIHKALNSSCGIIHCSELSGMTEMEIKTELQEQGVVDVHRVTVKRDTEKVPTNTLFLTFNTPDFPKEITVSYLKVKVALFISNPMRCFNCNKFGHTSQQCKVAAKCPGCGKDKHEGQCEGPKLCSNCNGPHASSAKDCPVWQKEKEIQHVRIEKCISFPEARQLAEAKMPTVITGGKTYAAAASTRRESRSVECQASLTWVFSERLLRTTESNVCSSGGPGSVSTSTQAPVELLHPFHSFLTSSFYLPALSTIFHSKNSLPNTSVFSSLLIAYFYLTGHSPAFIYNTALLYILLLTFCNHLQTQRVCWALHPMSGEDGILVAEVPRGVQHASSARTSPRWVVGLARPNQSAGGALP